MFTGVIQQAHRLRFLMNNNSVTILTGVGVTGTVATAYLTGKASFKAAEMIRREQLTLAVEPQMTIDEIEGSAVERPTPLKVLSTKDKARLTWMLYLPAGAVGITTIASILLANRISSKQMAALAVASSLSEKALQEYKDKVVEKLGEKQEKNIRDEISQDRVTKNPPKTSDLMIIGDGKVLCLDQHTGRYFESTVEDIKRAENKVNYEMIHFMYASASDFYDELGLPPTSYTDNVGWNLNNKIEVDFSTAMAPDGRPCVVIDFKRPPTLDYAQRAWD